MIDKHTPVLLKETIDILNIKKEGLYVDMTFGGGGHSKKILENLNNEGTLLAFDIHEESIKLGKELEAKYENFFFYPVSYVNYYQYLNNKKINGILMDLGFSSINLQAKRGFSYLKSDEELDMRYSRMQSKTAKNILNTLSINSLKHKFKQYDVTNINAFLKVIAELRKQNQLNIVGDLNYAITTAYGPKSFFKMQKIIFQALRIMVNEELENLNSVLHSFTSNLKVDGRIAIICFHSLEREMILKRFKELANPFPAKLPIKKDSDFELITKRPIIPNEVEILNNSRSKSAKLIAIRRVK